MADDILLPNGNSARAKEIGASSGIKATHVITSYSTGANSLQEVDATHGLPNTLLAGELHLGEVGGNLIMVSTEFTRPADTTAYAANDVVSNSTSTTTMQALANAARVSGIGGYIVGARLTTDKKSITPRFRVHFYNTTGATLSADNAAWQHKYADISKRVGRLILPAMDTGADTTNSDMSVAEDMTCHIPYTCAATSVYWVLETLDAFTPASGQKFSLSVFFDRN
jgi:hypothetical protein